MHMADALISPAVGSTMWVVSGGLIAYCAKKLKNCVRTDMIPMMGVLGAFVFAVQMLNFAIPGTGSSGHLGGGLLLAAVLGPHAAFLVISSVLVVQALFFADGGLLALGCNIFNLGFFPAFVAYPLIYRLIVRQRYTAWPQWAGSIVAASVAMLLGAFFVVLQTTLSGLTELKFTQFVMLMLPVHLVIGIVEGLATAAVVAFVAKARPESLPDSSTSGQNHITARAVFITFAVIALLFGGVASWFASTHPDGLEWSIAKLTGSEELGTPSTGIYPKLAKIQEKTAFMPDYDLKSPANKATDETEAAEEQSWPDVNTGTSLSGVIGGTLTLLLASIIGVLLRFRAAGQRS